MTSSLRPTSPSGPALPLAGKGIPRLHLPLGCGALGCSKMRNGPIYKQIQPEGGRRVGQGLYQGQRPRPLAQGALPREQCSERKKGVGTGGTRGLSERWGCGPFLSSLMQECPAGFQVVSGVSGEGQARLSGRGFFPTASLLLQERKCECPGQVPCKQPVSCMWAVVPLPYTHVYGLKGYIVVVTGPLGSSVSLTGKTTLPAGAGQRNILGGVSAQAAPWRVGSCTTVPGTWVDKVSDR